MAVSIWGRKLLSNHLGRLHQQVRLSGYIVLLPEVDPNHVDQTPLYKNGLPDLEIITTEKCLNTLGNGAMDMERTVREIENKVIENAPDFDLFDTVVEPVEEKSVHMDSIWGLAKVMYLTDNSKMPSESYLSIHERARKARCSKFNSRILYNAFKKCDLSKCTEEEQRLVSKYLTEGKLNGLGLGSTQREAFLNASVNLDNEKELFKKRVEYSQNRFRHTINDPSLVKEFPEQLIKAMAHNPDDFKFGPWDCTLHPYVYKKFLEYCPDRKLRWNLWMAKRQMASQHMGLGNDYSNSISLEKIRQYRREQAKYLGFESYVHMSMETKMADSVETVKDTLNELLRAFRPIQMDELNSLEEFAQEQGFEGVIELWDVPFWRRKQRTFLYHWDEVEMKEFFPFDKVLSGLMKITGEAFNLRFEKSNSPTWHPDIVLYNIYESDSKRPFAGLYVDPYLRKNKVFLVDGTVTSIRPPCRALGPSPPLSALICSFAPPSDGRPALLEFEQVEMLFDRFGEALQQLLSSVNYSDVSGTSNIEWDAVGVVGNFMKHWLTEPYVLKEISGHYSSNEALPIDNLDQFRKHLLGHDTVNEIYLSNLDIELHSSKEFWLGIAKRLWSDHYRFKYAQNDAHPLSFSECVTGQFGAAYFSKIWGKMLAADAYNTFVTESQEPNSDVGSRFRDTFLGFGGSVHPSEVFRRFQGRDPTPEAFINYVSS